MSELSSELIRRAIEIFLIHAYGDSPIPENRQHFTTIPLTINLDDLLRLKGTERQPTDDGGERYAFRLGNRHYPNMKMLLSRHAGRQEITFSVDTHDRFDLPENSPELPAVRELQARNLELARVIEQEWEKHAIPTQAGLLRRFLTQGNKPTPPTNPA